MAEMDSDQWAARFDEMGVPYAPVQTRAEWAASETVAANDLLLPVPGDGGTVGPGLPAVLSLTPGTLVPSDGLRASARTRPRSTECGPAARRDARRRRHQVPRRALRRAWCSRTSVPGW